MIVREKITEYNETYKRAVEGNERDMKDEKVELADRDCLYVLVRDDS